MTFNLDATSCYDRILASIASLSSRRVGVKREVTNTNTDTLQHARFRLKTSLAISSQYYTHTTNKPIHGTGQGSGNSPQIWCFLCSALFDAYDTRAHGACFKSYNGTVNVKTNIVGFVDDCNQRLNDFSAHPQPTNTLLLEKMKEDVQLWQRLLFA